MTRTEHSVGLDTAAPGRWLDTTGAPGAGEQPVAEVLTGGSRNVLHLVKRGDERMALRMPGPRALLAYDGEHPKDQGKEAFGAMVPDLIATAARLAHSGEER